MLRGTNFTLNFSQSFLRPPRYQISDLEVNSKLTLRTDVELTVSPGTLTNPGLTTQRFGRPELAALNLGVWVFRLESNGWLSRMTGDGCAVFEIRTLSVHPRTSGAW